MTDVAAPARGRSLWADAWLRLKQNRAATASVVYLVIMVIVCLAGPSFTSH